MNFLVNEDIIYNLAQAFPKAILNVGYPAICSKEEETCRNITNKLANLDVESATVGHAIPSHLRKMAEIANTQTNTSANFWIPVSDYMLGQTIKKPIEKVLSDARSMLDYWKTLSDRPIDIALVDSTARDENLRERLWKAYNQLIDGGARSIIICDTRGTASPKKLSDLLINFQGKEANFEYHPHNDNGLAMKNIESVVKSGAKRIGTAAFGFGERGTMIDPRSLVSKYQLPYDLDKFNEFERQYRDLIKELNDEEKVFTKNVVITGTQYRLRGRNSRLTTKFGVTSDKYILSKLTGINPEDLSEELLSFIKDSLYENRKRVYRPSELIQKKWEFENGNK
jgi:isopropylmalate/homocitrate/citramalate synthase